MGIIVNNAAFITKDIIIDASHLNTEAVLLPQVAKEEDG